MRTVATIQLVCTYTLLCLAGLSMPAQTPPAEPASSPAILSPGLSRLEGTNAENKVSYTRLFLAGTLIQPASSASPGTTPPAAATTSAPPTFTAQCTQQPNGRLLFEVFANFGGIDDFDYHRPWLPIDGGLFPPMTPKVAVTMEFLGYTRVKPVKRQWERMDSPAGQLRYNTPGSKSSNLEEFAYYLQYLRALPTLRLTADGRTAEFVTTPLLDQIRREPRCAAAHP